MDSKEIPIEDVMRAVAAQDQAELEKQKIIELIQSVK
jgi:hypothetical protein